jgi:hypothetical protein
MRRLWNITDALSQLANVTFLPGAYQTNANESVSGRAYREGWRFVVGVINIMFFWDRGPDGEGHCQLADQRDMQRARERLSRGDNEC